MYKLMQTTKAKQLAVHCNVLGIRELLINRSSVLNSTSMMKCCLLSVDAAATTKVFN
jgi:hypothetical protein